MPRVVACLLLASSVAAVACTERARNVTSVQPGDSTPTDTIIVRPRHGFELVAISGDSQVTLPKGAVPNGLVVRAVDSAYHGLSNLPIRWSHDLDGRFVSDTTFTDRNGYTTAYWVLGQTQNTYHATARYDVLSASFTARAQTAAISIAVEPDSVSLTSLGDTASVRLRLTIGGTVTYPAIHDSVSPNGGAVSVGNRSTSLLLQAVAQGSNVLSVPFGDLLVRYNVRVHQVAAGLRIIRLDNPTIAPDTVRIGAGVPAPLGATAVDARGNPVAGSQLITRAAWSVSDSAVAVVDSSGVASPGSDGRATLSVTAGALSATAPLRVWTLRAAQISVANGRACAVLTDGELACWGPRPELQNFGLFSSIAVSDDHSCGIRLDQTAWCWGFNDGGQLGNGTIGGSSPTPVQVVGPHNFTSLSVNAETSCGTTTDGSAWCWGAGAFGMLGDGTIGSVPCFGQLCSPAAVRVQAGVSFSQVNVALSAVCGLSTGGLALCWGANFNGELGTLPQPCLAYPGDSLGNHNHCATRPQFVQGQMHFLSVAAGPQTTCGVAIDGQAWCWGLNHGGSLGSTFNMNNFSAVNPTPTAVSTNQRFTFVAGGTFTHMCAIATDGSLYCWGYNSGELGNGGPGPDSCGSVPCAISPVLSGGGMHFSSVALDDLICGIASDGRVYCWGSGGASGDGTTSGHNMPTPVLYQR